MMVNIQYPTPEVIEIMFPTIQFKLNCEIDVISMNEMLYSLYYV